MFCIKTGKRTLHATESEVTMGQKVSENTGSSRGGDLTEVDERTLHATDSEVTMA